MISSLKTQLPGQHGQIKGLIGVRNVKVEWINMRGYAKSVCPKT